MRKDQRAQLDRLKQCSMLPGSFDKTFVRDLAAKPDEYELTQRQAEVLTNLAYKYRKQMAKLRGKERG